MGIEGYKIIGEWKVSNIGKTAIAEKGSKKYFLKQYGEYKMARADASVSLAKRMNKEFNNFKNYRIAINKALEDLAGPGGNIILPTEWFVDDINYVEATEFVEGLIDYEEIIKFPKEDILFVMRTAIGALYNIHRKKIVHSDLKISNILAARISSGKTVAKIIDFDRSYITDNIVPEYIGGSQNYMSPELAQCYITDMSDEALTYLSTKSDVFSLGIVFHNYLCNGEFPEIKGLTGKLKERQERGEAVYCGEALLGGGKLVVSSKIKEPYLRNLIIKMIELEPDNRLSSQEVLDCLKNKTVLPVSSETEVSEVETSDTKVEEKVPIKSSDDVSSEVKIPEGFCEGWPEHKIEINEEKIKEAGYVACEQVEKDGKRYYYVYKADGKSRILNQNGMLLAKFATRIGTPDKPKSLPPKDTLTFNVLWPVDDDKYVLDIEAIQHSGYTGLMQIESNGRKGYYLIKPNGDKKFVILAHLIVLKFVTRK